MDSKLTLEQVSIPSTKEFGSRFVAHSVVAPYDPVVIRTNHHGEVISSGYHPNMSPQMVTWKDVKDLVPEEELARQSEKDIENARAERDLLMNSKDDGRKPAPPYRKIIESLIDPLPLGCLVLNMAVVVLIYPEDLKLPPLERAVPYHRVQNGKHGVAQLLYLSRVANREFESSLSAGQLELFRVGMNKLAWLGYARAGVDESDGSVRGLFRYEIENDIQKYFTATELRLFRNYSGMYPEIPVPQFTLASQRYEALVMIPQNISFPKNKPLDNPTMKNIADAARYCYRAGFIQGLALKVEDFRD